MPRRAQNVLRLDVRPIRHAGIVSKLLNRYQPVTGGSPLNSQTSGVAREGGLGGSTPPIEKCQKNQKVEL